MDRNKTNHTYTPLGMSHTEAHRAGYYSTPQGNGNALTLGMTRGKYNKNGSCIIKFRPGLDGRTPRNKK